MRKKRNLIILSISFLLLISGALGTVYAIGGTGGSWGPGNGDLGGKSPYYYDCGAVQGNEAYKVELVYKPAGQDRYTIFSGVVWVGSQSDYRGAVENYVAAGNTTYPYLITSGELKDLANQLNSGVTVEHLESSGWLAENLSVKNWASQLGIDTEKLSLPQDDNPGRLDSFGYRILVQQVSYFCKNGGGNAVPRKELAASDEITANGEGDFSNKGLSSYQGDIATKRSDIGIKSGDGVEKSRDNFANPNSGMGYNIIWFENPYSSKNYSIDAACENCNNTLPEANGSYFIQDTINWDAIKSSINNKNDNVKTYYKKNGNVVCREEYKVTFPNANTTVMVKNGQYFTAGMLAAQPGHPNFAPIKVKRTMQCKDINGGVTDSLKQFANTELKSAGDISLDYVEGSSVDKLVTKNNNGVYNVKAGDKTGNDYSYNNTKIKENKISSSSRIEGDMAVIELESNYLLPDELYQYVKKNGKSVKEKPKNDLENYLNTGVPNLPVSFENKVTLAKDLAAVVKLSYTLPSDNSKIRDAWQDGNEKYFGKDNVNAKQNIYANEVNGESKSDTACAKLYGMGTSGYNTCVSKRQTDKMGDCKSVNQNDYVCPVKAYDKIKDCDKIEGDSCVVTLENGEKVQTTCSSVNSGKCVYNRTCEAITEKDCRIITDGKVENVKCKDVEASFPNGCPYKNEGKRCQTLDDYKTCELVEFKNGKWQYIEGSRKDCSVYKKDYPTCPPKIVVEPIKNLIYRPIDLTKPFPGMQGVGRDSGDNWCDSSGKCTTSTSYAINTNITNNRGVEKDSVYQKNPMYSVELDGTKIRSIKSYNNTHSYSDFTLNCKEDGSACISDFVKQYVTSGDCKNSGRDNFYTCKNGLKG